MVNYPKLEAQCLTGGKGRGGGKARTVVMTTYEIFSTGRGHNRYMARGESKDCSHALTRIISKADAERLSKAIGKPIKKWVPKK